MTRVALDSAAKPVAMTVAALAAAAAAVIFAAEPSVAEGGFDDTRDTNYAEAVDALSEHGITNGCEDGQFCPTRPVTRAESATLLARTFDLDTDDIDHDFPDVGNTVHAGAISAVAEEGLMNGRGDGTFAPNAATSRAEAASLLARAFSLSEPADTPFFYDVGGGAHAADIAATVALGASNGCAPGLFCPDDDLTRGQFALFLGRTLGHVDTVDLPAAPDEDPREPDEAVAAATETNESGGGEPWDNWTPRHGWDVWERLAVCESDITGTGADWSINTGNGYYGGLQFHINSWRAVGGSGYPHQASREEQIYRGELLQARQGWGAWPACSSRLGLR